MVSVLWSVFKTKEHTDLHMKISQYQVRFLRFFLLFTPTDKKTSKSHTVGIHPSSKLLKKKKKKNPALTIYMADFRPVSF